MRRGSVQIKSMVNNWQSSRPISGRRQPHGHFLRPGLCSDGVSRLSGFGKMILPDAFALLKLESEYHITVQAMSRHETPHRQPPCRSSFPPPTPPPLFDPTRQGRISSFTTGYLALFDAFFFLDPGLAVTGKDQYDLAYLLSFDSRLFVP